MHRILTCLTTIALLAAAAGPAHAATWVEEDAGPLYFQTGLAVDGGGTAYVAGERRQDRLLVYDSDPSWGASRWMSVRNVRDGNMVTMPGGNVMAFGDDVGRGGNNGVIAGKYGPADTPYAFYDYTGGTGWGPTSFMGFRLAGISSAATGSTMMDVDVFGKYAMRSSGQANEYGPDPYGSSYQGRPVLVTYDGSAWVPEIIADINGPDWVSPSHGHLVDYDAAGNPVVIMHSYANDRLEIYRRQPGGTWVGEGITGTDAADYNRAAIAMVGNTPYVAWVKYDDTDGSRRGRAYLSHKVGGVWVHELLDEEYLSPGSLSEIFIDIDVCTDPDSVYNGYMAIAYSYLTDLDNTNYRNTDGEARILLRTVSGEFLSLDALDAAGLSITGDSFTQNKVEFLADGTVVTAYTSYKAARSGGGVIRDVMVARTQSAMVPEPLTMLSLIAGSGALAGYLRRRRR